jgi:hypothetical protein
MPEKFVYNADFTDERGSPPEPALSKAEWAGMTKRESEDDEERARMTIYMTLFFLKIVCFNLLKNFSQVAPLQTFGFIYLSPRI